MEVEAQVEGTVKWFTSQKNYGWIERADGGADVFVHVSGISGEGYKILNQGQHVMFDVEDTERGSRAINVETINR